MKLNRMHFPLLDAGHIYFLQVLIGSLLCLRLLGVVKVTIIITIGK